MSLTWGESGNQRPKGLSWTSILMIVVVGACVVVALSALQRDEKEIVGGSQVPVPQQWVGTEFPVIHPERVEETMHLWPRRCVATTSTIFLLSSPPKPPGLFNMVGQRSMHGGDCDLGSVVLTKREYAVLFNAYHGSQTRR